MANLTRFALVLLLAIASIDQAALCEPEMQTETAPESLTTASPVTTNQSLPDLEGRQNAPNQPPFPPTADLLLLRQSFSTGLLNITNSLFKPWIHFNNRLSKTASTLPDLFAAKGALLGSAIATPIRMYAHVLNHFARILNPKPRHYSNQSTSTSSSASSPLNISQLPEVDPLEPFNLPLDPRSSQMSNDTIKPSGSGAQTDLPQSPIDVFIAMQANAKRLGKQIHLLGAEMKKTGKSISSIGLNLLEMTQKAMVNATVGAVVVPEVLKNITSGGVGGGGNATADLRTLLDEIADLGRSTAEVLNKTTTTTVPELTEVATSKVEVPKVPEPVVPEVIAPVVPEVVAPVVPKPVVPVVPEVVARVVPEPVAPVVPEVVAPVVPEPVVPVVSEVVAPVTPKVVAPVVPEVVAPVVPEVVAPVVSEPVVPEVLAPVVPEVVAPVVPEPVAPVVPEVVAPVVPEIVVPEIVVPEIVVPEIVVPEVVAPVVSEVVARVVPEPVVPVVSEPVIPAVPEPVVPEVVVPAVPEVVAPVVSEPVIPAVPEPVVPEVIAPVVSEPVIPAVPEQVVPEVVAPAVSKPVVPVTPKVVTPVAPELTIVNVEADPEVIVPESSTSSSSGPTAVSVTTIEMLAPSSSVVVPVEVLRTETVTSVPEVVVVSKVSSEARIPVEVPEVPKIQQIFVVPETVHVINETATAVPKILEQVVDSVATEISMIQDLVKVAEPAVEPKNEEIYEPEGSTDGPNGLFQNEIETGTFLKNVPLEINL